MKSMTGYGRAEATLDYRRVTVEIFSVNRRQSDFQVLLPSEFSPLESKIREYVSEFVSRGQVTVRISATQLKDRAKPISINHALATAYYREFKLLAKKLGIQEPLNLELILRAPGVLQTEQLVEDQEGVWEKIKTILDKALKAFIRMRVCEGKHLEEDLRNRVRNMEQILDAVEKRAPVVVENYRQQIKARIKNAGISVSKEDEERLLKEIVIFADRSDISEEIVRLRSHFKKFYEYCRLKNDEAVGRTLDFLAQEMNREINTIGSKANDSFISHQVVALKTELEKFREQVQNVE